MTDEYSDLNALTNQQLEHTIRHLRTVMERAGSEKGLGHLETLHLSQRLDRYVMEAQRRKSK